MTKTKLVPRNQYIPDWVSPPGDTIADSMEELGISAEQAQEQLGLSPDELTYLLEGRLEIDQPLTVKLAAAFGANALFWENRELNYRTELVFNRIMSCCEVCGNKRCPHVNEGYECTNSNEPDQEGSEY